MMQDLRSILLFLLPWEFAPVMFAFCTGAVLLYILGLRRTSAAAKEPYGRVMAYLAGWALIYVALLTRFEYLSTHMFFLHTLQQMAVHHLGPFLVALAQPQAVLLRALPKRFSEGPLRRLWRNHAIQVVYRTLQRPYIAPLLYVGLIFMWLAPTPHFYAMLSAWVYWLMNWSMLLDGLLFWFLMLDPRSRAQGALIGIGTRILIIAAGMAPQMVLGAYIAFAERDLYSVYDICGRAWEMSARTDQNLGGLIVWIPVSLLEVVAMLVLLRWWIGNDQSSPRTVPKSPR